VNRRRWRARRKGFALMTVLWVMVAASLVALAGSLAARDEVDAAANRVDAERAMWRANDCLERQRDAIDAILADAKRRGSTLEAWRRLDRATGLTQLDDCDVRLEAAGSRLDVNDASAEQLRTLFRSLGLEADALADRLLDWRDVDDDPRTNGAERDWYLAQARMTPRNGPLADIRELARIAGFESLASLESVLGVEPGRISINTAPASVLSVVPGFTDEVLARIALERESGRDVADVLALAASVSRPAADSIMAHFPDISRQTTVNPDAWIVVARGWAGSPATEATIDARLVLDDGRAAMLRRRTLQ
jgi:general secretion pathway protein K